MDNLEEILVVEDDLILSRMHQFCLKSVLQKEVRLFENAKEAMDYLDKKQLTGKFLVLLDLNMPVMNGWEFLEATKNSEYSEDLLIVVVTSSPYKEDIKRAAAYERVLGVYTKPFKRTDVSEVLDLIRSTEAKPANLKNRT